MKFKIEKNLNHWNYKKFRNKKYSPEVLTSGIMQVGCSEAVDRHDNLQTIIYYQITVRTITF
jgi:hypothetical protein